MNDMSRYFDDSNPDTPAGMTTAVAYEETEGSRHMARA